MCNINKLVLIEKKINFAVTGVNQNGNFIVKISSFLQLPRCPETAILIGRVIEGKMNKGDIMEICLLGKDPIWETAQSMQINKNEIFESDGKKSLGIKLKDTTFEELKKFNVLFS